MFTKFIQDRFSRLPLLHGYRTIEQCAMDYSPERGSSIDPHIDDCWIWGERIVQLNLLADCVLTFKQYQDGYSKYNLKDTLTYNRIVSDSGDLLFQNLADVNINANDSEEVLHDENDFDNKQTKIQQQSCHSNDTICNRGISSTASENYSSNSVNELLVRVPMPARSLLSLYGAARYEWEHFIYREDVTTRRLVIAYREFTPPYLEGGKYWDQAKCITKASLNFW